MKAAPLPANEAERLVALRRYKVLDTDFEDAYNELTQLVANVCQTPIALISLIDDYRQWFKAKVGLEASQTPRDWAFCSHAILQDDVLVVEDALCDARFHDNPLVTSDPSIRFYAGAQIRTPDGYCLGTVCAIDRVPRHITEFQKNALRVLANQVTSQLELRLAVDLLQEHTQRLEELNATKDKLFSVISHDLRSPVGGIWSLSEMLIEDLDTRPAPECRAIAVDIHNASEQTLNLLDNLLRWSLVERGQFRYQPAPVRIDEICARAHRLVAANAVKKQLDLRVDCPPGLEALGDAQMLGSVIQNLLSNAIKFTAAPGDIVLHVSEQQGRVRVEVRDSGVGMNAEQIQRLFRIEKNQSTPGTAGELGTGLGLVLCQQFLGLHGSQLRVHSAPGKGTVFSFELMALPRQ